MRTAGSWGWDGAVLSLNGAAMGWKRGRGWLGCAVARGVNCLEGE